MFLPKRYKKLFWVLIAGLVFSILLIAYNVFAATVTAIDPTSGTNDGPASITSVTGTDFTSGWDKENGLKGNWRLDETNGSTTVDVSGNSNTGTLVNFSSGNPWTTGKLGNALTFDGVNDYVTIPTISVATNITVSAWVKSPTLGTFGSNMFIVSKSPVNTNWNLFLEAGSLIWRSTNQITTSRPSSNVWHHIAATQANTAAKIYVDGVQIQSGTMNAIANGGGAILIGQYGAGYFFNGLIDEVRIYNRVLSGAEIQDLFNAGNAQSSISFVNKGSATTPSGTHASAVSATIPATVAGNDLIVVAAIGDDPDPPAAVTSVTATDATFTLVNAITNATSRAEIWSARNIPAGITSVTVNTASATVFNVLVGEYSGVGSLGSSSTASGTGTNPTISLTTQDSNNWVVGGFSTEGTAIGSFSAQTGNLRASGLALGDGAPDVAGALTDNTSASPASVTNSVTGSSGNWSAAAVELRSTTTAPGTVKLRKASQADITCTGFTLASSSTLSSGSCPITSAATGAWDVRVTNPDNTTGTLASGFTVNEAVSCSTDISSTSFGVLTDSSVITASSNASTTMSCSNTGTGCALSVLDAGNAVNGGLATTTPAYLIPSPNAAFDPFAALVAGTEGYGITATTTTGGSGGTLAIYSRYDKDSGGNTVGKLQVAAFGLASSTAAITNRQLIVKHKAAISATTQAGAYEDTITYSCLAN